MSALLAKWEQGQVKSFTPEQFSIRLRLDIADSIDLLMDRYPRLTRTQIVNDLLETALCSLNLEGGVCHE